MSGMVALFGGKNATNATVLDDHTMQALTPSGPVGLVDVIVRNPNSLDASLPNSFEFIDVPLGNNPTGSTSDIKVIPTLSVHSTPIRFENLPAGVTIRIYNTHGQLLTTLNENQGNAVWDLTSNSHSVGSGTYLYHIDKFAKGRIVVVK
jgi:hypothetical protein